MTKRQRLPTAMQPPCNPEKRSPVAARPSRLRLAALVAVGWLALPGSARAQNDDVMGFGAESSLSHPAAAPKSEPASLLPPPSVFLASLWSAWPPAWAYVPSLWSTWYRESLPPPAPAVPSPGVAAAASPTASSSVQVQGLLTGQDSHGLPPPRLVRKRRYNLVISGAGMLAGIWAADRLLANNLSTSAWSWVPLIGPWYLLSEQSSLASPSQQNQFFLIADGILQATGLTMAILGFVLTTKRYVVTIKPASEPTPKPLP